MSEDALEDCCVMHLESRRTVRRKSEWQAMKLHERRIMAEHESRIDAVASNSCAS